MSSMLAPPTATTVTCQGGATAQSASEINGVVAINRPIPEFLYQLTQMLTDQRNSHLIEWKGTIKSIIVHDPTMLETEVLQKYFRHKRFASFQRQLNYFGFRKIKGGKGGGRMSPCSYVNETATEDVRSLLLMKRRVGMVANKANTNKNGNHEHQIQDKHVSSPDNNAVEAPLTQPQLMVQQQQSPPFLPLAAAPSFVSQKPQPQQDTPTITQQQAPPPLEQQQKPLSSPGLLLQQPSLPSVAPLVTSSTAAMTTTLPPVPPTSSPSLQQDQNNKSNFLDEIITENLHIEKTDGTNANTVSTSTASNTAPSSLSSSVSPSPTPISDTPSSPSQLAHSSSLLELAFFLDGI